MVNNRTKIGLIGSRGFIGTALKKYLNKKKILYEEFIGDLLNEKDVCEFFDKNNLTTVIHLAGQFDNDFRKLFQSNVITTQNILDIGIKKGLKKIIYASSGAVYGEPLNKISKESDPTFPNTPYGLSKAISEEIINYHIRKSKIKAIILRFPNVYGPNNDKGVIYNFLNDIKKRGTITIKGDGKQSRNFLHIQDACRAIELSINYEKTKTFNISTKIKTSLLDLLKILSKSHNFKVVYEDSDNGLHDLLLDTTKAEKELGFKAKIQEVRI